VRVAALYDVHGNLPALEAVLAEVEALEVEAPALAAEFRSLDPSFEVPGADGFTVATYLVP